MRVLLWAGFGGLLLLMGVLGLSALSFLYQIELRQESVRKEYVEREQALEKLRANIYLSGTYARDLMLESSEARVAGHRSQFIEARGQILAALANYERLLRAGERPVFQQVKGEIGGYLAALNPILQWNAAERAEQGRVFVDQQIRPRRMQAIAVTDRMQQLSERLLEQSSQAIGELFSSFRVKLLILLVLTAILGIGLAGFTLGRILKLENESDLRFREVLSAQDELKRLSAELLSAQESERRRISRELHDEVGQVLSAMMLGLGNLQSSLKNNDKAESLRQLQLVLDMTERNASVVRNLSLLLRPTMLDDLGLVPALKWLAREVSRTSPVQVDVFADDCPEDLPEEHRTCVYRIVQEAVRNAVRHAGAKQIHVQVRPAAGRLSITVQDDGQGFEPAQERGLGILGMEERVVRLGGTLAVESTRGRGTSVNFELPLPQPASRPVYQETSPFRTA
jgi:signal transduction histidine kinase